MAILSAGLLALYFALGVQRGAAKWTGRFGAAAAVAAFALYGALSGGGRGRQQAGRCRVGEHFGRREGGALRERRGSPLDRAGADWSYQAYTLGLALLLFAVAVLQTAWVPRPIAYLMGLSGLTYLVQGWVVGSEGFSPMLSNAIVLAEVLGLVWMIWLVVVAWRMKDLETPLPGQ